MHVVQHHHRAVLCATQRVELVVVSLAQAQKVLPRVEKLARLARRIGILRVAVLAHILLHHFGEHDTLRQLTRVAGARRYNSVAGAAQPVLFFGPARRAHVRSSLDVRAAQS